jgi:hypothetical protein
VAIRPTAPGPNIQCGSLRQSPLFPGDVLVDALPTLTDINPPGHIEVDTPARGHKLPAPLGCWRPADSTRWTAWGGSRYPFPFRATFANRVVYGKCDRSVLGGPNVARAVRPIGRCIRVRVVDQFPARQSASRPNCIGASQVQRCMAAFCPPVKGWSDSQAALR